MMSINAVKGVEVGEGFASAALTGEENADEMRHGNGAPLFLSNHAGGITGGISTGQDIVVRFAVKPTSSILSPRETITTAGDDTEITTKGRHDPCVGIRAVPVGKQCSPACWLTSCFAPRAERLIPSARDAKALPAAVDRQNGSCGRSVLQAHTALASAFSRADGISRSARGGEAAGQPTRRRALLPHRHGTDANTRIMAALGGDFSIVASRRDRLARTEN